VRVPKLPEWLSDLLTYLMVVWMAIVGIWVYSIMATSKVSLISNENSAILDKVFLHIKAAESEKRGWMITGDDRYFGDYITAVNLVRTDIRDLNEYLRDRPAEKKNLEAVGKLVDQKVDEMEVVVKLFKTKGREAAFAEISTNKGYFLSKAIQDSVERIKAQERDYIRHRMAQIF
jgi:CHASE3 domain sensor protein